MKTIYLKEQLKQFLFGSLIGLTAISSLSSHAQNRVGNGGQSIYSGGNAYLRDIVEKNNCLWKTKSQILNSTPVLNESLEKMYSLNSSFTLRLEEGFGQLGFCFTTKRLPYLQYNNSDDIHIFANQEFEQVAINDKGIVFVDLNIFEKMDNKNKAFLFFHEIAHELFDKNEERSSREPRLREFLLNMSEQLDQLYKTQNVDTFNYIVSNAKFKKLENVYNIDHQAFETVFLNLPEVTLKQKVLALKSLNYPIGMITTSNGYRREENVYIGNEQKVYSEVLKHNIMEINTERVAYVESELKQISYRTSLSNLTNLVEKLDNLKDYIIYDKKLLSQLTQTISYILEKNTIEGNEDIVKKAYELIPLKHGNTFASGKIAVNYDRVFGPGQYLNKIMNESGYLAATLFGKVFTTKSGNYARCKGIEGWFPSSGQQQCYSVRYISYVVRGDDLKLSQNEKGLVYNINDTEGLGAYLKSELKLNRLILEKVKNIIREDINLLKKSKTSNFTLPQEIKVGEYIKKKGRYKSGAKYSSFERKKELEARQSFLNNINM